MAECFLYLRALTVLIARVATGKIISGQSSKGHSFACNLNLQVQNSLEPLDATKGYHASQLGKSLVAQGFVETRQCSWLKQHNEAVPVLGGCEQLSNTRRFAISRFKTAPSNGERRRRSVFFGNEVP